MSPAWAGGFLTTAPPGKSEVIISDTHETPLGFRNFLKSMHGQKIYTLAKKKNLTSDILNLRSQF